MSWNILSKTNLQYLLTRLKEVFDKKANIGVYYGTCSTDEYTAEKAVVVSADQEFVLKTGVVVNVMFAISNSSSTTNVKINVNNTGAKSIYYNDEVYTSSSNKICGHKDRIITYVYDGTYWSWIGTGTEYDTTYSVMPTAELVAGTSTSERVVRADYLKDGIDQLIAAATFVRGHIIKNNSGTSMTARESLQFQGTYVSDDSTNDKTVVPIVRSMQQADFDLLSSDEKTGLIDVTDSGYSPSVQTRLLDLTDCSIVLPGNGQILKYDSTTSKWVNANEVSVPEIVDNLTTDDATKTLSAKQGKVLGTDINRINTAYVVKQDNVTLTVNSTNYTVTFYKYSNGMKQFLVALSNFPAQGQFVTEANKIPTDYLPSHNVFDVGFNGQYSSTSTTIDKTRCIALTPSGQIYIYGSGYAGCWVNTYYC